MPVGFLKSPRAASRIAAARAFLDRLEPGAPFLVLGHGRHAANRLAHEAAEDRAALFGAFRFGFRGLAAQLAGPELTARGLRPLTDAARLATVVRVVHRARRAGRLGRFGAIAEGPGLAARLAGTFDELRLAGVEEDAVAAEDPDLGTLYAAYREALAGDRLADRAEIREAARQRIETDLAGGAPAPPVGLPTVFLDVPLQDRASRRFAAALAGAAPDVLLTLPEGDGATEAAARGFGAVPAAAPAGRENPAEDDAVAAAQRHLFGSGRPDPAVPRRGLTVIAAPGTAAEALEIARAFLSEASKGVAFDRMAVLLPEPGAQASAFREAFARAGIPAFFEADARRPHPAGRAFLALLDCALEDLSADRFAEYLSLGQTPVTPPRDEAPAPAGDSPEGDAAGEEEPGFAPARRWERLILDAGVIGGLDRWKRRLARFAGQLRGEEAEEEDAERREQIGRRRKDLRRLSETALPILDRLAGFPTGPARYGDWATLLRGLAGAALRHPEGVLERLAETEPMSEVDGVTLDEVRAGLARRLAEEATRSGGGRYGRVWVGPIGAARGLAFEVAAAPGLTERAFPRILREDPMLPDRRRRKLSAELPLRSDLGARERLRLRIAVGAATRRLILGYSSLDLVEGRPRVPSYYLAEAFRAGLGKIPTLALIRKAAAEGSEVVRGLRAPRDPSLAVDRREFDLARVALALEAPRTPPGGRPSVGFLLADPALGRALRQEYMRQSRKWQSPDGFLNPDPAARDALAAHRPGKRPYSATGLESFAACPYQFFLKNIVRLRPVERPESLVRLDPLTRGALLHEVLCHLGRELQARGLSPLPKAGLREAFGILEEAFRREETEMREQAAPRIERIWRDQMDGLLGDLRGFLTRLAGTGIEIVANELAFGLPARRGVDPGSRPEPALLSGGLLLHGSIDAVERLPDRRIRITDYKTGRDSTERDRAPHERITFGGRALQPLLYALAYESLTDETVAWGRLYYATVRGAYQETLVDTANEESRGAFEEFLSLLDRAVELGRFPALPNPKVRYTVCDYCDYRPICGPRPLDHERAKPPAASAGALREVAEVRELP